MAWHWVVCFSGRKAGLPRLVGVAHRWPVRLSMAGAIDDARKIKDAIEHDNVELVRRLLNHTNCELMERCRSA